MVILTRTGRRTSLSTIQLTTTIASSRRPFTFERTHTALFLSIAPESKGEDIKGGNARMDHNSSYPLHLPSSSNSSANSSTPSASRQQLQYHLQQQQRLPQHQLYSIPQSQHYLDNSSPTHSTPPTSASVSAATNWPPHRTSNTREEIHPSQQHQQFFLPQTEPDPISVKREPSMTERNGHISSSSRTSDDPMPSTSDFVKKLYKYVLQLHSFLTSS